MTFRSLLRGVLVASAFLLAPAALAQSLVGGTVLNGGIPSYNVNATAPFTIDQGTLALRVYVVNGTGGGGGGGSSGPSYVGQYNSTLPTFANGQTGYLSVDSNGRLLVSPGGTQTVSGTVTANLGTLNGAATQASQAAVQGSVAGGASATVSQLMGGRYNASAPSLSDAQQAALQLDASGNLKVNGTGSTVTANQGGAGSTPWPIAIWQGGTASNSGNPIFTQVTNLPSVQAVTAAQLPASLGPKASAQSLSVALATDEVGPALGTSAIGTMAQDGNAAAGSPFTFSALTTQTGFRTAGYNSASIELVGTATLTVQVETSSDSTNGTDGTWTSVSGAVPNDNSVQNGFATLSGGRLRLVVPTNAGPWMRLRATAFTSGSIMAYVTLRAAPYITHDVYVGAGTITLTNGSGSIGGISSIASSGGINSFSRLPSSAATTNLTQAKAAAGRVYKVLACNTTTTPARIKFYNALSANVTVGTTVPLFTRPIPAAAASGGLACASYDWADIGTYFTTGISWAITTGAADSDTTAVAAGAVTDVSVEYQ